MAGPSMRTHASLDAEARGNWMATTLWCPVSRSAQQLNMQDPELQAEIQSLMQRVQQAEAPPALANVPAAHGSQDAPVRSAE